MTTHITARIAWHDDGWNGRICKDPAKNTYCVGLKSYPGDMIAHERDLEHEIGCAGKAVCDLKTSELPPCTYSLNAFGPDTITGYSKPPDFFFNGADPVSWEIPPATVAVWPYEAMYSDEVKQDGYLNNNVRKAQSDAFFDEVEADESLVFYYANHSNPFSDETSPVYVIVGVSRVKKVGEPLFYENPTDKISERYAGGMVWARNITSHYPDEGLRIPYHRYRDKPDLLERIAIFPENPRTCKYGAKHLSDDTAIGLLEQFLDVLGTLKEIEDDAEDWAAREKWVHSQIARLWQRRGLYPGLLSVMDFLNADKAIPKAKLLIDRHEEKDAYAKLTTALETGQECSELGLIGSTWRASHREWQLLDDDVQAFLLETAMRIDLSPEQLRQITGDSRIAHGLGDNLSELINNPFILSERFVGNDPDDIIPWSTIDRGVFPSPELGGLALSDMTLNDAQRLRALCVEQIHREPNQTFRPAENILQEINSRLDRLPEWKRHTYTAKYFSVDKECLEGALVFHEHDEKLYMYLKSVFEDERTIEVVLSDLTERPLINLKRNLPKDFWSKTIIDPESELSKSGNDDYLAAVSTQVEVCDKVFRCPLSVVTGRAGTGKTTVIRTLVKGIRRVEGDGAPIYVLTPTGKATDRVRAVFHGDGVNAVDVSTIHSFLAKTGWLNPNLTLKRTGGQLSELEGTIIIDETSMLDLSLAAAFCRTINWQKVKRLILVGDHNQLPPIGRGRVFSDIIQWLRSSFPENLAVLTSNLRQLENKIKGQGTGILSLAELFLVESMERGEATTPEQEEMLSTIQAGGDISQDLRVEYWNSPDELMSLLKKYIEHELRAGNTGTDEDPVYKVWREETKKNDPERLQVLSPHRGEPHGIETINLELQSFLTNSLYERVGSVDGISINDKVIQVRNRPASRKIWAYDFGQRKAVQVEIFNGEIGYVGPHNFDTADLVKLFKTGYGRRIKRFQVKFARKSDICVNYGREIPTAKKGFFVSEKVEDNLELAYAISIHKSQGSEFDQTFVVLPDSGRPLSTELLYTALTRAKKHCTLLIQRSIAPLIAARRKENAQSLLVSSSLLDNFRTIDDRLLKRDGWYESGKIHEALSRDMVRSKSEVIIANLLNQSGIPFEYEQELQADDGSLYLPDFTIYIRGERYFWEHWGRMDLDSYKAHRQEKLAWYNTHFPNALLETFEGPNLSAEAKSIIDSLN